MKIIGFNLHKLSIERKNALKGKLNIKSKLDIEDIRQEIVPISKSPALKFDFAYSITYEPNVAKTDIKGSVIALDDKNEAESILKEWKSKKFSNQLKVPLFNFILSKCNLKALKLEDELGLPLHIPFPKLRPRPDGPANYTG